MASKNLENTNDELVKMMNNITAQKDEISSLIEQEEKEKAELEMQMNAISEKIEKLEGSLKKKRDTSDQYAETIQNTQDAFNKILESSQTLLHVLKKEGSQLHKKKVATLGDTK